MSDFEHISSPVDRIMANLAIEVKKRQAEADAHLAKHDNPKTRDRRDLFNYETKATEAQETEESILRWKRLKAIGLLK